MKNHKAATELDYIAIYLLTSGEIIAETIPAKAWAGTKNKSDLYTTTQVAIERPGEIAACEVYREDFRGEHDYRGDKRVAPVRSWAAKTPSEQAAAYEAADAPYATPLVLLAGYLSEAETVQCEKSGDDADSYSVDLARLRSAAYGKAAEGAPWVVLLRGDLAVEIISSHTTPHVSK